MAFLRHLNERFRIRTLRRCGRCFQLLLLLIELTRTGFTVNATTLVLPIEAIRDSRILSKEKFKEIYPGIDISGQMLAEEGWYVLYRHENLTYLFGPLKNRRDAEPHLKEIQAIREAVIAKRKSLDSSEVRLIHYTFDSVSLPAGGSSTASKGEASAPAQSGDAEAKPGGLQQNEQAPGSGSPTEKILTPTNAPPNTPNPSYPTPPPPPNFLQKLLRIFGI